MSIKLLVKMKNVSFILQQKLNGLFSQPDTFLFFFFLHFNCVFTSLLIKRFYLFIFREGKGGRKRVRETSMCGCLSSYSTGVLACNPGMCPDWESNWWPFGSQASAQSTEPHQPGPCSLFQWLWLYFACQFVLLILFHYRWDHMAFIFHHLADFT